MDAKLYRGLHCVPAIMANIFPFCFPFSFLFSYSIQLFTCYSLMLFVRESVLSQTGSVTLLMYSAVITV